MRKTSRSTHSKKAKPKKHDTSHATISDFYTAEQKRQIDSEKLEAQMFEHLKKLRKTPR